VTFRIARTLLEFRSFQGHAAGAEVAAGAAREGMTENEIATKILDAAFRVHTELGPGLLEAVYRTAMVWELTTMGLRVQIEHPIPLIYRGDKLKAGFRADLLVEGKVIVELKSLEIVPKVARKILLTYIRLANVRLGVLINFGEEHLKDGIERVVNNL
jgi:GxxExxY protein